MAGTIKACVFRPGGDYTPQHVRWLKGQAPGMICLGVDVPLAHDFPGWWSKLELFRPDFAPGQNILFFDLDTVIRGDIEKYCDMPGTTFLEDFFYPEKSIGSGMMFIAHDDKALVWNHWIKDPAAHMREHRGDQDYLKQFFWNSLRWQREFPGEIISYKKHLVPSCKFYQKGFTLEKANVVCFHGQPRPWEAQEVWTKDLYQNQL